MAYNKPIYVAELFVSNCKGEFFIDDILFFSHYKRGSITLDLPINMFLPSSGTYQFKIKAMPFPEQEVIDKHASASLKIFERDAEGSSADRQMVAEIPLKEFKDKAYENFETETPVKIQVPYSNKAWTQGMSLAKLNSEELQTLSEELKSFYTKLIHIIETKNLSAYNALNNNRMSEMAVSLYLPEEKVQMIEKHILDDYSLPIEPKPFSDYRIEFYGPKKQLFGVRFESRLPGFLFKTGNKQLISELFLFQKRFKGAPIEIVR